MNNFDDKWVRSLMHKSDVIQFGLGTNQIDIQTSINNVIQIVSSDQYSIQLRKGRPRLNKAILLPNRFADKIFLRHLNRKIARAYRITHSNRDNITKQVAHLLETGCQIRILRTDISGFFKSIPLGVLLTAMQEEGKIRSSEINYLKGIAATSQRLGVTGLPWGLSISSTLSEIFTRSVDRFARQLPGVIYYQRFVDDIIVFCSDDPIKAKSAIESFLRNLSPSLKLNPNKTQCIDEGVPKSQTISLDFLGYSFIRPAGQTSVNVSISDSKMAKYKRKIHRALHQFRIDKDWYILRARIKVLTGNYYIEKDSHEHPIPAGIYHNYPLLNDLSCLDRLNSCLQSELIRVRKFLSNDFFYRTYYKLGYTRLFNYCFRAGYVNKITHKFSVSALLRISKSWE